jgi:hypothetical protein
VGDRKDASALQTKEDADAAGMRHGIPVFGSKSVREKDLFHSGHGYTIIFWQMSAFRHQFSDVNIPTFKLLNI